MLLNAAMREIRLDRGEGNDVIVDPAMLNQSICRNVETIIPVELSMEYQERC